MQKSEIDPLCADKNSFQEIILKFISIVKKLALHMWVDKFFFTNFHQNSI